MTEDGTWSDKAKSFLEKQSKDLERKICILKRKRKAVKVAFTGCITISIICSTICASSVALQIPAVVISILSTTGALSTALSMRFKLKRKQNELNTTIDQLEKIKYKLDYVVSCNGNFSEDEFRKLIGQMQ